MGEPSEDQLVQQVIELNRDKLFEAALALQGEGEPALGEAATEFLAEVEADEWKSIEEVEELARGALVLAALDPDRRQQLGEVLERVGRKAFILGGAELVIVGSFALGAMVTYYSKGRKSEEEKTQIVTSPDGTKTITHEKKVVFGMSVPVGKLLARVFGNGGG